MSGTGLVDKTAAWVSGGVAEADCLMCHWAGEFNHQARNLAPVGPGLPKIAATMGLADDGDTGPFSGGNRLVDIDESGDAANMTSFGTWKWTVTGTAGEPVQLTSPDIVHEPANERCAVCHFANKEDLDLGPGEPGDVGKPFGYTAFQKRASMTNVDDGTSKVYNFAKGRVELGKRSEMLNGPASTDVHMGVNSAAQLVCSDCHYVIGDRSDMNHDADTTGVDIDAMVDGDSNVVYPGINVRRMDHQFAKGHNLPDGKNMDQLDGTVTCESCHTTRTHPKLAENWMVCDDSATVFGHDDPHKLACSFVSTASAECATIAPGLCSGDNLTPCATDGDCTGFGGPGGTCEGETPVNNDCITHPDALVTTLPLHDNFPASHVFGKIDCRTCHIPVAAGFKKKLVADYTTAQLPVGGIERAQGAFASAAKDPATNLTYKTLPSGIRGYMPLLRWQPTRYDRDDYQIVPVGTMLGGQWFDLDATYYPKRFATTAAQFYQNDIEDGNYDGVADNTMTGGSWDWKLNEAQGGDKALIVNTTTEIAAFVDILQNQVPAAAQIGQPQLKLTFGLFNISHNVLPSSNARGANGCSDCHSESSDFFNRTHTLFKQPKDQSVGLQMTCANGDCSTGTCDVGVTDLCVGGSLIGAPCATDSDCGGPLCDVGVTDLCLGGSLGGTACVTDNDCDPRMVGSSVSLKDGDGNTFVISLTEGKNHEDSVANGLDQATVLGYNASQVAALSKPQRLDANEVNFYATATATQGTASYDVDLDASNSQCGVFECADPTETGTDTCQGGVNVGVACTTFNDCPGACSSFDWEFTDLAGAPITPTVTGSGAIITANTGNTTAYRATLTVGDGSGITASTSKLVAGAAVVTPTYPTLTGVGSTDASGTASLTIVSNGYNVLGSYIDWRDKKRQRVKTLGPHSHTYTFVGTGMTYSAKVRVTYIDHLDGNRVKNKFVIQPLYVE